jgi:tagatose-1,6-bisphosphate aldolase
MSASVTPVGKLRGLQQCSDGRGTFAILALDHRNNLRRALRPDAPGEVTDDELVAFKRAAVAGVAPAATAVLLDPEFGAAQSIAARALPGDRGLVVAVESTGYGGETTARRSGILPGWSVGKARRIGASAVKLLVYYHPKSPTAADVEALVREVAADCDREDIPLLLEPPGYSLDPSRRRLSADDRRRVVVETARRLVRPGVDVLKAEFPGGDGNGADWLDACRELSHACAAPWLLLSGSADFETFLAQAEAACSAGASGVAVGRGVWREATVLAGEERAAFLASTARARMARVAALCAAKAQPWTAFHEPRPVEPGWYARY